MPKIIQAKAMVESFDHMFDQIFERQIDRRFDWSDDADDSEVSYFTALSWGQCHYDYLQDAQLVRYGLFAIEKPFREANYVRVHGFPTELGERVYRLGKMLIDWDLQHSRPSFKTSVANLMRDINRAEITGNVTPLKNIPSILAFWYKEFPRRKSDIRAIEQSLNYALEAGVANNLCIRWNSEIHCADKERTLHQIYLGLRSTFDDLGLRTMQQIIKAAHAYWPDDPDVIFWDDEIALTLLSRYHYNGRYHIDPQEDIMA